MKNLLLASASLLILSAAPVMAADVVDGVAYEAPVAFDWTGGYIGVQAGYGWSHVDQPYGGVGGPIVSDQDDADGNGILGGVHIGYNFQSDSFVYGVEADLEASNIDGDDGGSGGDVNGFEVDWMGSVRARLGYAMDRTLFYATGGYAFMRGTAYNADVSPREEDSATFHGWTLGAGVEYAFTDHVTARLEYRYADFGSRRISLPASGYDEEIDPSIHAVRIGFSYKF